MSEAYEAMGQVVFNILFIFVVLMYLFGIAFLAVVVGFLSQFAFAGSLS